MPVSREHSPLDPARIEEGTARSSFADLLDGLDLSEVQTALDVGAGGFVGETTTVHLLDRVPRVTALELDPDRARALEERFGGRLDVACGDVRQWREGAPYDLVVLDLDSGLIPAIFEDLLPGAVLELVRPGGIVITLLLDDAEQAYHGPKALSAAGEAGMVAFLDRHFGRRRLDDAALKAHFAADPHYRALAKVEKWRGDAGNFIGWLALQRRFD